MIFCRGVPSCQGLLREPFFAFVSGLAHRTASEREMAENDPHTVRILKAMTATWCNGRSRRRVDRQVVRAAVHF